VTRRGGRGRRLGTLLLAAALVVACSDDRDDSTSSTAAGPDHPSSTSTAGGDGPGTAPDSPTTTVGVATTVAATVPEADLGPEERAFVEVLAPDLGAAGDRCTAVQFVDLVGADRLRAAGIDPTAPPGDGFDPVLQALALDRPTAEAVYDRFVACGDDPVERFVTDLVTAQGGDADAATCVRRRIDHDAVRDVVIHSLRGAPTDSPDLGELAACFPTA